MPLNINSDEMLITDDKGNEHVMKILFTYDNEERHKSYVFLFEKDDEENVVAFSYNEQSEELSEITDDEEAAEGFESEDEDIKSLINDLMATDDNVADEVTFDGMYL